MRKKFAILVLFLLVMLVPQIAVAANVPNSVLDAADSVVYIEVGGGNDCVSGTGFIVYKDKSGTYIATNNHVVKDDTQNISIWTSKSICKKATIVAQSESQDLAIVHLDMEMTAKPLFLNKESKQGEEIYAIGFPSGADALSNTTAHVGSEATITNGLISSIRSISILNNGTNIKLLQISADINAGNSGGPLLNSKGQVIGINAFGVIDTQGINGAIASDELISLINTYHLFQIPQPGLSTATVLIFISAFVILSAAIFTAMHFIKKVGIKRKIPLPKYLELLGGSLDCASAVTMLIPIAQYLKNKHDQGSVFLRLYPGCILVTRAGCMLNGKYERPADAFLSPEQKAGAFAGVQADVYAFCALLNYVLQGHSDMENDEEREAYHAVIKVVKKGMSTSLTRRYRSMQDLIIDLAPLNRGMSAEAMKPFAGQKRRRSSVNIQTIKSEEFSKAKIRRTYDRKKVRRIIAAITAALLICLAAGHVLLNRHLALKEMDVFEFEEANRLFCNIPLCWVLFPKENQYIEAGEYVTMSRFQEAIDAFGSLGDYRNAPTAVLETKYRKAESLLADNEFVSAQIAFSDICTYKDASDMEMYTRYLKACAYAEKGDYEGALLILKQLQKENYSQASDKIFTICCQQAADYALDELYGRAYKIIFDVKELGDAAELLLGYREDAYQHGVALYHQGKYVRARREFNYLEDYLETQEYIYLCSMHLGSGYTYTETDVDTLLEMQGFEDSAEILLENTEIAKLFLLGTWNGDGYYFTMNSSGHIQYNLPYISYGDYYRIEDGVFLIYPENNYANTRKLFTMTVVSRDCILVYAHKSNRTYMLYRK